MPTPNRICITPRVAGVGGMVSFAAKFAAGLAARGIEVTHDLDAIDCDAVLIIGGTWRNLLTLRRAGRAGKPIVQRLDGMNWLHTRTSTGLRHWLRAESANQLLAYIRARIATRVVYQSEFVNHWWIAEHGNAHGTAHIIRNGVDLDLFSPSGGDTPPTDKIRILMVEGSLQGGYELGLESAVTLANELQTKLAKPVELNIVGRVDEATRHIWTRRATAAISWRGVVPNNEIPALNRSAHFLYSSDINAACPNSVIEAMACGLPVLAFDTGALKELVTPNAGRVVPYGGDPWKLDPPDVAALVTGAEEILAEPGLRAGARDRAEEAFGLDKMVDAYLEVLSG
jgi:glycosyltransferase involved in cell wall biosynthesis